jgi:hypothetical protein
MQRVVLEKSDEHDSSETQNASTSSLELEMIRPPGVG